MSFDRIARSYQLLETIAFGSALQRARTCWIDKIPAPKQVLIVGEGDGRFLCELLRVYPTTAVDCLDASERMLELARSRVLKTGPESLKRIQFLYQDILTWSPLNGYDLVVTHFFLDCFRREELKQIVQKIANAGTSDAAWLIADFTIPSLRFARLYANLWLRGMYSFFRFAAGIKATELVDPGPYLCQKGFVRTSSQLFRGGMLKSEMYRRGAPDKAPQE